jgi:hypothetical protein
MGRTYSKQNECAKELRSEKGWESISGGDIEKETTFEVLPSCASTSRSSSGESQTDLIRCSDLRREWNVR